MHVARAGGRQPSAERRGLADRCHLPLSPLHGGARPLFAPLVKRQNMSAWHYSSYAQGCHSPLGRPALYPLLNSKSNRFSIHPASMPHICHKVNPVSPKYKCKDPPESAMVTTQRRRRQRRVWRACPTDFRASRSTRICISRLHHSKGPPGGKAERSAAAESPAPLESLANARRLGNRLQQSATSLPGL